MNSVCLSPCASADRTHARIMLGLFVAVMLFFVGVTLSPLKSGFADAPSRGPGDVALYRAEVDRIRAGETYYEAAAEELPARGYPTHSVFNWRTPLPVWLVAMLPSDRIGNALLGALALLLIALSLGWLADEVGSKQALFGGLLLIGALMPCLLGDLMLMSELWSGVLIALSAVCFGLRRPAAGVLAGVAALFFRELAAPYVLVCLGIALVQRDRRQLVQWSCGLLAYAGFYALHVAELLPQRPEESAASPGWLQFGGAGFVISAAQMNAYLLLLPQWVTAIYLACVLLGCATWNGVAGQRVALTVAAYLVAFSFVGNDFNQYWGSLIAPLLCLPASRAPGALAQLWTSARHFSSPAICLTPSPLTGEGRVEGE